MTPPPALPRRPLTVGELLDAAAQLMRSRGLILLAPAALFAGVEQGILVPVRRLLGVDFVDGFQGDFGQTVAALWVVMSLGCALEAYFITALGVWAGRAAASDLAGRPAELLRPRWRDLSALIIVAPVAAVTTGIGAFFGPLWILAYGLFGMAGAAIGLERRGPFGALGRAAGMALRSGMRAVGVRTLGYFAWVLLRLGFFVGVLALLDYLSLDRQGEFWVMTAGFVIANSAAYVFLATLDAATLAEGRFRSEGLDIWLSRAERHATLTPQTLAAQK